MKYSITFERELPIMRSGDVNIDRIKEVMERNRSTFAYLARKELFSLIRAEEFEHCNHDLQSNTLYAQLDKEDFQIWCESRILELSESNNSYIDYTDKKITVHADLFVDLDALMLAVLDRETPAMPLPLVISLCQAESYVATCSMQGMPYPTIDDEDDENACLATGNTEPLAAPETRSCFGWLREDIACTNMNYAVIPTDLGTFHVLHNDHRVFVASDVDELKDFAKQEEDRAFKQGIDNPMPLTEETWYRYEA